ncbi:MAG: hypothetical protein V4497_07860 [Bacteroidota bacterium]
MKTKNLLIIVWTFSACIVIGTILAYAVAFRDGAISDKPEIWGSFGDYFSGLINPFLSLLNLLVLTYLTIRLVDVEDSRNKWTLRELARPYGDLSYNLNGYQLDISLLNYGLGPMVVTTMIITSDNFGTFDSFSKIVNPDGILLPIENGFLGITNNHCAVQKDGLVRLVHMSADPSNTIAKKCFDDILTKLLTFQIEIRYNDIYGTEIGILKETITFS